MLTKERKNLLAVLLLLGLLTVFALVFVLLSKDKTEPIQPPQEAPWRIAGELLHTYIVWRLTSLRNLKRIIHRAESEPWSFPSRFREMTRER